MVLGVVLVFLTLAQCTVNKPESPSWDTNLTVPLLNRTYPVQELVERIDQEGLIFDSVNDIVSFNLRLPVDTLRFDADQLSTADLQYHIAERLEEVTMTAPSTTPVNVTLASIAGLSSGLPNDSADVTAMGFTVFNTIPAFSTFSSATFSGGTLRIQIDNNLGVSLDTIYTQLYDIDRSVVVSVDTFATPLATGANTSVDIFLGGKTMSNNIRVTATCHTPGGTVTGVSTRYLGTSVEFPDELTVTAATAQIPTFSCSMTQSVAFDEDGRIDQVTLGSGMFRTTITNASNLTSSFTVTVPDLKLNGVALTVTRQVGPFSTVNVNTNLAGYQITPTDVTTPQQIMFDAEGTIFGTGSNQVQVNQSDSFVVVAELSNLNFASITGAIDSTVINFDNFDQNIDVPMGLDSAQIQDGMITLEIENALDMPGTVDITLNGNNGKTMHLSGVITPGSPGQPSTVNLSDTSAGDFFSPIPSEVTIVGSAVIGDGTYTGTITEDDYVVSNVIISAPLNISIPQTTFDADVENADIESDDIDEITDHITEAQFVYSITNHLPLGASVSIYISTDSATVFTSPLLVFDSLSVDGAPVTAQGVVTDTTFTGERTIVLDSADIQVFNNPVLYIGQRMTLESTDGQFVKMTGGDYVHVVGRLEFAYRFDGNF